MVFRERVEKEYAGLYEKHGLGLTIFSPLKSGFLSGKYNNMEIPQGSRLQSSEKDPYISTVTAKFKAGDPEVVRNVTIARAIAVCPIPTLLVVAEANTLYERTSPSPSPSTSPLPNSPSHGSSRTHTSQAQSGEPVGRNRSGRMCVPWRRCHY